MVFESKGQCSTPEYISSQQMCNYLWGVERSENIESDVEKINGVLFKFGFKSQGGAL